MKTIKYYIITLLTTCLCFNSEIANRTELKIEEFLPELISLDWSIYKINKQSINSIQNTVRQKFFRPELNIWNIIPMMSQSLSSRPLIASNKKSMEIQLIQGPLDHAMVCVDGQKDIPIKYNNSIYISKKNSSLKIIHPSNNDFYEACREKLGWSLDITAKKNH